MCSECEKSSLPNQFVFDKIESIIRLMQDEQNGLPVKTAKSFMSKIPSVFTGTDLIQWMLKNLKLEDLQEAIHLANLIASHGYIFPIEDHTLSIKNDCTFYRFQTPCLWPSNNVDPENTDYAVYLCKRTMQGKTRLELADYEAENLARLQKMFSRKWEFIFMQAESQAKVDKKRDKLERKVLDSQERAFWDVYRPVPGCVNTTELDIKKACRLSKSNKRCADCSRKASQNPEVSSSATSTASGAAPPATAPGPEVTFAKDTKPDSLEAEQQQQTAAGATSETTKADKRDELDQLELVVQADQGGPPNSASTDTENGDTAADKEVDKGDEPASCSLKQQQQQQQPRPANKASSSKQAADQPAHKKGAAGHHHHHHHHQHGHGHGHGHDHHHHHHHHHHHPHQASQHQHPHQHPHQHHHRQCPHHKQHQAKQQRQSTNEASSQAASALAQVKSESISETSSNDFKKEETEIKELIQEIDRKQQSMRAMDQAAQFMRAPSLGSSLTTPAGPGHSKAGLRRKSECNRMLSMNESSAAAAQAMASASGKPARPASACCSKPEPEPAQANQSQQQPQQQVFRKSSLNILRSASVSQQEPSIHVTLPTKSSLIGTHSVCPNSEPAADSGHLSLALNQTGSNRATSSQSQNQKNMIDLEKELELLKLRLERRTSGVKMSKVTQSYLSYFKQWAEYDPFIAQPIPSNPWISDSTELWDSERQTKDVHCRRVRRWAFSLKELLNDPAGREQFHKFLEKEFSAENLKFWDAVQELKRVHSRDVARRVEAIWTEYLAPDANCPINIDSKSYETSKKNMAKNKNNRYIFDEAAGHVYQLMKNDSYPRYLRSDMYKDYKDISEKRRTNQVAFDVFKPQITTLKHKFNF